MKNLMMGLAAICATSFAIPAFAEDAPKGEDKMGGDKMEKKEGKKGHKKHKEEKGEEKKEGKM